MRVLYVPYATWKAVVQANGFAVYDRLINTNTYQSWCGGLDLVYRTDVEPSDASDYTTAFPTRTTVADEDEAIANIVGLAGVTHPRSADGTVQYSKQQLELGRQSFKRTDNASEQMNVNGIAAGTPVNIWNGTGILDVGSDWTRSGVGSETAQSAHSGTNGLDSGVTTQNDMIVFDAGSMQDIASLVSQVELWVQLKVVVGGGNVRVFWVDDTDTMVGNGVLLSNYLSNFDLDDWKKPIIPIEDFNLTTDVQKLVFRFINVSGIHLWIDDVAAIPSAGGGPHIFRVLAPTGFIYHIERIALVVSAPDAGWSSTAFANIVGGLTSGLAFRYRKIGAGGETYWAFNCQNNIELFGQLTVLNDINFDDAEQMVVFALEPQLSSVVLVDDDEVVEIIVRDDLSSLTNMRAFLHYGVEELPT